MSTEHYPPDVNLLAVAVEASGTSFIIADHTAPDDPIIYCNTAFERLTGFTRPDILGHNCRFLQGDDRQQVGLVELRAAIAEGREVTVQLHNYRKDGTPFLNELAISPVRDADGNITHLIGIQRDVSTNPAEPHPDQFHHEWRTPLTIVRSTLQVLQQKGLDVNPDFLHISLDAAIKSIDRLEKLGRRMGGDPHTNKSS